MWKESKTTAATIGRCTEWGRSYKIWKWAEDDKISINSDYSNMEKADGTEDDVMSNWLMTLTVIVKEFLNSSLTIMKIPQIDSKLILLKMMEEYISCGKPEI